MKFCIITFGCASNREDSNIMTSILERSGHTRVEDTVADFIIINTCAVKGPTENKIIDLIDSLSLDKNRIILCGCLPSERKFLEIYSLYSTINSYNIDKISEAIDYISKNKKPFKDIEIRFTNKSSLPSTKDKIGIVQPLIGCLGNCSYCRTKLAKSKFYSYPLQDVIKKITTKIDNGAKEIWISSEDNGAYGKDINLSFMVLLKEIEANFSGKAMFRFGMINPWLLYPYLDELTNFMKNTKAFYKFLHIPVQSASNRVLESMRRPYTAKMLDEIFIKLGEVTDIKLTTDIIIGYPTESAEDFIKSYNFIQRHNILNTNISQFWPREGTDAKKLKQLDSKTKKERSVKLTKLSQGKSKKKIENYVNAVLEVYPYELDSNSNTICRTKNYITVILNGNHIQKNKINVKIIKRENYHLIGEIID